MAVLNAVVTAEMVLALKNECTAMQMAKITGADYLTCLKYLRVWHRRKVVYVCDWKKAPHGQLSRVWALRTNQEVDAQRPIPLTRKQIEARKRERDRAKKLGIYGQLYRQNTNESERSRDCAVGR